MIALLVGTVAFFALWVVALKPGSSSNGGTPTQGLSGYQADINKAHKAVQISGASNAAAGGGVASSPAPATAAATPSATPRSIVSTAAHPTATHKPATATTTGTAAVRRLSVVQRALHAHKAVALLFYNPGAADDQAVKQELAAVATHRGKVVKLTIPLSELASYTAVTDQVPVNFSPTLVVIAPNGQEAEIVGFSDQFEIAQRIDDALAAK